MNEADFRVDIHDPHPAGGQYAGVRPRDWTVTHIPTGVSLFIPADAQLRSQFKTKQAAIETLEYYICHV